MLERSKVYFDSWQERDKPAHAEWPPQSDGNNARDYSCPPPLGHPTLRNEVTARTSTLDVHRRGTALCFADLLLSSVYDNHMPRGYVLAC